MGRMWTITRKELLHIIRDQRTLSLVIIMPAMMLLLLGYAVATDIEDIGLAIADNSKTDESRRFIERFWSGNIFEITHYVDSEKQLLQLIDAGAVRAGMIIPEEFGREVATGGQVPVQFFIDGSDPSVAQTAQLSAQTIGQMAAQEILIQQFSGVLPGGQLDLPIETRLRFLYNPDMRQINFMVPGLLAVILQIQTLLLTAFAIVREREQGTMEQLIVTPVKSWELMLGKILPFVLVALLNVALTLAVGVWWFRVPVAGSVILLLMLSLIFLMGSLGLGVLISNISRTQMQAMYISSFIMIPSFILSGLYVPRDNMPWLAFYGGYLLPVTYYLDIVRGIIVKGVGANHLWGSIWPMAVFSVAVFAASVFMFRKRID